MRRQLARRWSARCGGGCQQPGPLCQWYCGHGHKRSEPSPRAHKGRNVGTRGVMESPRRVLFDEGELRSFMWKGCHHEMLVDASRAAHVPHHARSHLVRRSALPLLMLLSAVEI